LAYIPSRSKKAIEISRRYGLKIAGLHMHIGSGIYDVEPYLKRARDPPKTSPPDWAV